MATRPPVQLQAAAAVPTTQHYEAIRAVISRQPWTCELTSAWSTPEGPPPKSCDDPTDLKQDNSLLWAMDRFDIPQPPAGWRRRVVVRGGTSNRFADVYYHAPNGRQLRSMNDIEKFLSEHPQYAHGIDMKQHFSYAAPRPLTSAGGTKQNSILSPPTQKKVKRPGTSGESEEDTPPKKTSANMEAAKAAAASGKVIVIKKGQAFVSDPAESRPAEPQAGGTHGNDVELPAEPMLEGTTNGNHPPS
eukprot:SM000073S21497  [mRNA]  locus=s73:580014:582058:- [translate_table: standard]